MAPRAHRASGTSPAQNFGIEETLLDSCAGGEGFFFLYVNEPCLVAGRNQNPWVEFSPESPLPRFRRISGGGGVYQDRGNLNWAFILPRGIHDPDRELAALADAIGGLGLGLVLGARGGLFGAAGSAIAGRKVSGSARRFSARAVLHHGTFLVSSDLGKLASSLGGISTLSDQSLPSKPASVANLDEALPGLDIEELSLALFRACAAGPPIPAEEAVPPARLALARHSSWEWTYGQTPPFSVGLPGVKGAILQLRGGRVSGAEGEALSLLDAFRGEPFDYSTAARASASLAMHETRRNTWTTRLSSTPSSVSQTR